MNQTFDFGWICSSPFKKDRLVLIASDSKVARKSYAGRMGTLALFVRAERFCEADDMPVFYGTSVIRVDGNIDDLKHKLVSARAERRRRIAEEARKEIEESKKVKKAVASEAKKKTSKSASKSVSKTDEKPKERYHPDSYYEVQKKKAAKPKSASKTVLSGDPT